MGARRPLRIVVGVVAVAAAGCGGGSATTTTAEQTVAQASTSTTAEAPIGAVPIDDAIAALAAAGTGGDCDVALRIVSQVRLPDPEAGATPKNCKVAIGQARVRRGFEPAQGEEFGTGAVVEGRLNGKDLTVLLALDGSKAFKWAGLTLPRPEVGTQPIPGVDYEENAARLVAALRAGDCHAAYATISPDSRLTYQLSEGDFCSGFDESFMTEPASLGARLQADKEAKLTDLGGTTYSHFFGLATEPAGYRTFIVSASDQGHTAVSDVVPLER